MQSYGIMLLSKCYFWVSNPVSFFIDFDHRSIQDMESYLQKYTLVAYSVWRKGSESKCSFEHSIVPIAGENDMNFDDALVNERLLDSFISNFMSLQVICKFMVQNLGFETAESAKILRDEYFQSLSWNCDWLMLTANEVQVVLVVSSLWVRMMICDEANLERVNGDAGCKNECQTDSLLVPSM